MGALGGIIKLDGSRADAGWLRRLSAGLRQRGPDGEAIAVIDGVGLVHRSYGTNATSLWKSPDGDFLAFDGRLDNRSELASSLHLIGSAAQLDSSVLLEGFHRRGSDFAGDIIGDFALAHWSVSARRLTLARDAIGACTLYYVKTAAWLAFASDLGSLVKATSIDQSLDEEFIAPFLHGDVDEERTIYRHVKPVRAGHAVTLSCDAMVAERAVWSLSPAIRELQYRDDRDYERHFRQLFEEAVAVRLRTNTPVTAELSGGLDSSSIVCVAHDLIQRAAVDVPSLHTMSYVMDRSTTADDGRFLDAVEQWCGRDAHHLLETADRGLELRDDLGHLHIVSALMVASDVQRRMCAHLRATGSRVLLSGTGGDEMFYPTNRPLPGLGDLWAGYHLLTLHRDLKMWSVAIREPYLKLLWRSFDHGFFDARHCAERAGLAPWLHAQFRARARQILDALRERRARRLHALSLPSRRDHAAGFYGAVKLIASGGKQEFDPRHITYPCLHRPLVEYMHAVPFSQKLRCGERQSLQRGPFGDFLPAFVRPRRGKGRAPESYIRRLREGRAVWESLLTGSRAAECGYIDPAATRMEIGRYCGGLATGPLPLPALAIERWLRVHAR